MSNKITSSFILVICIFWSHFDTIKTCLISSQQIGVCRERTILSDNSFCGNYISDYVCVPEDRLTWSEYDSSYRDSQLQQLFMSYLEAKLVAEYNSPGSTEIVANNINCYYAYRKFLCAWNFPQCDPQTDTTQSVCKSDCSAFFSSCEGNTQICDVVYEEKDIGLDNTC